MKLFPFGLTALATSSLLWFAAPTPPAQAGLCIQPYEVGDWVNRDSNTDSITRAQVRMRCNELGGNRVSPTFSVRLFGSCVPTDCEWENVGLSPKENGWFFGMLDQGFATRRIWVRADGQDDLEVYISTDFTAPGRQDYSSNNWFTRRR